MTRPLPFESLPPTLASCVLALYEAEQYDSAVFEAFKFVEGELQERLGSSAIGNALLDQAFGSGAQVRLSDDPRDQDGLRKIFEGALGAIRSDRAHKKSPLLPCRDAETCLLYLSFAALLLRILREDKNLL